MRRPRRRARSRARRDAGIVAAWTMVGDGGLHVRSRTPRTRARAACTSARASRRPRSPHRTGDGGAPMRCGVVLLDHGPRAWRSRRPVPDHTACAAPSPQPRARHPTPGAPLPRARAHPDSNAVRGGHTAGGRRGRRTGRLMPTRESAAWTRPGAGRAPAATRLVEHTAATRAAMEFATARWSAADRARRSPVADVGGTARSTRRCAARARTAVGPRRVDTGGRRRLAPTTKNPASRRGSSWSR